jgi:hypothetical protein
VSTALDVDISTLVGEMEAPPCESTSHDPSDRLAHDDGPAAFYVRVKCPACGNTAVRAYCQQFINFLIGGGLLQHSEACGPFPGIEWMTILGPVGGTR